MIPAGEIIGVAYPVERHRGHISTLKTFGHAFVDYAKLFAHLSPVEIVCSLILVRCSCVGAQINLSNSSTGSARQIRSSSRHLEALAIDCCDHCARWRGSAVDSGVPSFATICCACASNASSHLTSTSTRRVSANARRVSANARRVSANRRRRVSANAR
jgi:hypothetical protein